MVVALRVVLQVLPWGAGSQAGADVEGPRHEGTLENGGTLILLMDAMSVVVEVSKI
jgi:hypothetical protein